MNFNGAQRRDAFKISDSAASLTLFTATMLSKKGLFKNVD